MVLKSKKDPSIVLFAPFYPYTEIFSAKIFFHSISYLLLKTIGHKKIFWPNIGHTKIFVSRKIHFWTKNHFCTKNMFWPKISFFTKIIFFGRKNHFCAKNIFAKKNRNLVLQRGHKNNIWFVTFLNIFRKTNTVYN